MKHIEQKLTSDAQAFKHTPNAKLHDRIMQNILTESKAPAPEKFSIYKWLISSSLAAAALLFVITTVTNNEISAPTIQEITKDPVELNMGVLALNFESKLTSNIELEQQAIVNDLNYFKSLLAL